VLRGVLGISERYPREAMPVRATKRGDERTPLSGDYDVLICGASFAGLTVARELAGSGARTLVLDRYEIGERQTSACAAPTEWLETMGVADSIRQTFDTLVVHTPHTTVDFKLPWTFSTFDYRQLCGLLWDQCDARFETATVRGVRPSAYPGTPGREAEDVARTHSVETDRGLVSTPLIVDALGWKRVLAGNAYQPPDAPLSRGLEVHPAGSSDRLEIWIDRGYVPAGYGWSFPAGDEVRIGVGSFDPGFHVKEPTVHLATDLDSEAVRYQGNWIPHKLRDATADGVFFVGDSAGHCLPLTAEGIRTAFYFGMAAGREIRAVVDGRQSREQALAAYGAFSASHARAYRWLLTFQNCVGPMNERGPLVDWTMRAVNRQWWIDRFFNRYLAVAPPSFVGQSGAPRRVAQPLAA
jgi:flavin-dependent dehydrogenase